MCDAESEKQLKSYVNVSYPTVIAVCETPKPAAAPVPPKIAAAVPVPPAVPAEAPTGIAAFADRIADQVRSWYLPDLPADEALAALTRLRSLSAWVPEFDGEYRSLAALKDMTSQLIGRFIRSVEAATRAAAGSGGRLTRYGADVVVPAGTVAEIAALKGLAAVYVMTVEDRQPIYARQRELLAELVELLASRSPDALDPPFATAWRQSPDDAGRLRAVIDQVASLTDARAVNLHRSLSGMTG